MSITQAEATQIRTEQAFLKDQVSELVKALNSNTEKVGEMLIEMKERDVRDEYREKEHQELKEAIHTTNERIESYIKSKQAIVEWAERRKSLYDSIWSGITSTWGKLTGALIIIAIASALGLDLSKVIN